MGVNPLADLGVAVSDIGDTPWKSAKAQATWNGTSIP
jgi:hypothetical protein